MKNVFADFRDEKKRLELKEKIISKTKDGLYWAQKNKEILIPLAGIIIAGTTTIVKVVGKNVNLRKQESLKDLYCYDRSLGHYWQLRRTLTNQEWLYIDQRKSNGERLADILSELKVLK